MFLIRRFLNINTLGRNRAGSSISDSLRLPNDVLSSVEYVKKLGLKPEVAELE